MSSLKIKHKYLLTVLMAAAVMIFLIPFYLIVMNSFKSNGELLRDVLSWPKEWIFTNYVKAYSTLDYPRVFLNSLLVTVFSNLGVVVISALAAYRLERFPTRGNKLLGMLFMAGLIIPFQVVMIPLVKVLQTMHLVNTLAGVILTYWGMALPFTIFLFRGFIQGIPREIEEAAMVDGCALFYMFWKIVFPLLKPIMFTAITVNTFWFWNDFLLPQLIISDKKLQTIPIAVNSFFGQYVMKWDLALPALVLAVVPAVIVFICFQKQVVEGIVSGAVKG